jgi:hypothetical protein
MPSSELPGTGLSQEAIDKLEALDDVIFPAIDGDLAALDAAADAWKTSVNEVGVAALAETRCEYLRYARSGLLLNS